MISGSKKFAMSHFITSHILSQYSVAVFDLDGTLCNTQGDVFQIFQEALAEKGLPPAPDELIRIGLPLEEMFAAITGKTIDAPIVVELTKNFRKKYDVSDYPHSHLYPGVESLLRKLKAQGVYLAIATYKQVLSTLHLLEVKGILPLFDAIMSIDTEERHWTKTEMLERILANANQPASQMVFFGDTASDIRATKAHGVTSVAALYGYGKPEELQSESPDFYCETLLNL